MGMSAGYRGSILHRCGECSPRTNCDSLEVGLPDLIARVKRSPNSGYSI
ncbi:hypothetical protein [Anaplasma phagocytophilum]|nr:hypothetical protein [Anaplasma phagocytophilum]